jgi:hypothetical protein
MSTCIHRTSIVCGFAVVLAMATTAQAQWMPYGNACGACAQPVARTCYRTVPVTEYRQVKRIVQRPVCETEYVEQPVTEYRAVVEAKTVNVPTVSYQNVTECKTVCRNQGYWRTRWDAVPRMSPCQYDNRRDLVGMINRSAYSIRSAFVPRRIARREYVPNMVTQTIPVTRRVAHHSTRKVTYNVTRMVPYTTTRKVAVRKIRYVAQEITTTHPVTVMRTVPIGTSLAYSYAPYGATTTKTAIAPTPDPVGSGSRSRTADQRDDKFNDKSSSPPSRFKRESSNFDTGKGSDIRTRRSSITVPVKGNGIHPVAGSTSMPSIVRVSRWTARVSRPTEGPILSVVGQ